VTDNNLFSEAEGATALDPDETDGLIPTYISTREELNVAEQTNIAQAVLAAGRHKLTVETILTDAFVRDLHKRMFGQVWTWAGKYRKTEKSIGIDPFTIAVDVCGLAADATYWFGPDVTWISQDQAVAKVHHRLVAIHPFPNGNGRHARAYCDLFMKVLGGAPLTWGGGANLQTDNPDRSLYLKALHCLDADPNDYDPLVQFARS
jgi:Fic-DOC domain mobile mystery protein B